MMKKFLVEFERNNVELAMDIEAADMASAKEQVKTWKELRERFRGEAGKIKKVKISLQS